MHLDKLIYPNGITATYGYDGAGRLTGIDQKRSDLSTVFSIAYTLDKLGNRTALSENLNGVSRQVSYIYDELSRLTQEIYPSGNATLTNSHPVTTTYTYDTASNRSQMITTLPANTKLGTTLLVMTTNYTYNEANQLTQRSDTGSITPFSSYTYAYTYDPNGSLTAETNTATGGEVTGYSYDVRNRLSGWQKTAKFTSIGAASFSYDGANNRQSMTYGGQTTTYLQDAAAPLPVVLMEKKGSADPSIYLYSIGASTTPLLQVSNSNGSGGVNPSGVWYHSDGLGSVRALTSSSDTSGTVVDTSSYSAFGSNVGENNTGKVDNTHRFAGEQLDPTGLYYNRARYYNPSLGRFIGRDPVKGKATDPFTLNRYIYAANNPGLLIDPSGNYVSPTPQPVDEHDTPISDADAQAIVSLGRAGIFINDNSTNSSSNKPSDDNPFANYKPDFSYGGGRHTPSNSSNYDCGPDGIQNKQGLGCAFASLALDPNYRGGSRTITIPGPNGQVLRYGVDDDSLYGNNDDDPTKDAARAAKKALEESLEKSTGETGNAVRGPARQNSDPNLRELPSGQSRTPEQNAQARRYYRSNRLLAMQRWEERTGRPWPVKENGEPQWAEHPRQLKEGGDPLFVEPGVGPDPNAPHSVPGPDGLTDHQRWGQQGGLESARRKKE